MDGARFNYYDGRRPQGEAFLTHAQVNSEIAGLAGTSRNPSTSGAGFIPSRAGYIGKIAWSNAVLSLTFKASFVLMCSPCAL
jgi:hypothetical protein